MRVGSLFSGAGGFDIAVEAVFGGRTIWHADNDPAAAKVLAAHWPGVPNHGDVTTIDWSELEPVDVLCAGFPCQDVSTAAAGFRRGMRDGNRSGLWAHMALAIAHLRPPIVAIENVRGLLSATAHRALEPAETSVGNGPGGPVLRGLGAVLGDLSDLRYDSQWVTFSADEVGAPHGRDRVFILAADASDNGRAQRPQHDTGHQVDPPHGQDADRRHLAWGDRVTLLPMPSASDGIGGGPNDPINRINGNHQVQLVDLGMRATPDVWGRYSAAITRWERLTRPAPVFTEPSARAKYGARLNAAFSEWMMGWPAGWVTDVVGRNDALRIIGNGCVPQQAEPALRFLLSVCEAAA